MRLCGVCAFVLIFCIPGVVQGFTKYALSPCKTPTLKNGRLLSRQRGRAIKFVCNVGYSLYGDRMAFCRNGQWDVMVPKCVRPSCPKKDILLTNGIIITSNGGAVMAFYCKPGYELNGPAAVYCDGFGWVNNKPSCLPFYVKPPLTCDFEDADICHWTHDLNHDMDWVRDSYKTPTGYSMPTGPSHDHTKGNASDGHYMYIESSSRRINDTARLISPLFELKTGNVCLEFWYHMYGKTIGTLRAYMKTVNDSWPLNPDHAVFSKSGNQGNLWHRAFIDLGQIRDQFQIIMEGVRGNGYVSDIAIDDVQIIPNCTYEDHMQSTIGEFVTSTSELLKTVESCENRCGQNASGNESAQLIPCDCDEDCYENSRCCPDYIDVCVLGSSTPDWSTTTSEPYTDITAEPPVPSTVSPKKATTIRPTTTTSKVTRRQPTIAATTPSTRAPKTLKPSTKRPQTPQRVIPTLHFIQPPSTPKMVEIIIPKPNKNVSKITFVKPKTTTTIREAYHDDIEVPTKPGNQDEELLLTTPLPLDDDSNDINDVSLQDKEDYVEKLGGDKDYPFKIGDVDHQKHIGEIKTEDTQPPKGQSLTLIALGAVCGIAILGVLTAVALVKFRFRPFRNRRMASGQGDSQSDVRFLTADEVLDFNLDNHYDEL